MDNVIPAAVITGGTAGVGRATAVEFARNGYNIGLIARGQDGLEETCRELEAFGVKTLGIKANVANSDEVDQAAERIERELGPIDVWVNCAMATVFSPVDRMTALEYREVTEITYLGYVHGTLAALRHMKPRDYGSIVQVGSALAYRSIPLQSAYCASKAAIRGFTDSLRSELLHDDSGIRVTMVQLPAINTPQFEWARNKMGKRLQPMPPIYQPEVAGRKIFQAAMETPRELWVGSSTLMAIVGTGLLPSMLDRMMANRGYRGQTTREDADPDRPDNLEHPVAGLHHEHGRFDRRSRPAAVSVNQETITKMGLAAAGIGLLAAIKGLRGARSH